MIACVPPAQSETVIKRSRFIAVSYNIDGRDQVKGIIEKLKSEHPEARHVCYAFIADEKGDDFGYDDDGEPSGTAGKPIYSALAAAGVRKTLIAVVRYFGGIKLGAGGLTRAYRGSAAELIEKAGTVNAEKCAVYSVESDGAVYKTVSGVLRNMNCTVDGVMYDRTVSCTVTAPVDTDITTALTALGAKVTKISESYKFSDGIRG